MILWAFITAGAVALTAIALLRWSYDEHVSDPRSLPGDPAAAVYRSPPVSDLMQQLEWAELWFDTTSADQNGAIPCDREHGLWLFRTAIARIKELER